MKSLLLTLFISTFCTLFAFGQQSKTDEMQNPQTETSNKAILRVLNDFQDAIIDNDAERASALLMDNARILESGGIETKEEYLSHHFHSDGRFLSAMERQVLSQKVLTGPKTAWVTTTSRMSGTYNERELDLNSAELAVLVKTEEGWKISAVHWSSRSND